VFRRRVPGDVFRDDVFRDILTILGEPIKRPFAHFKSPPSWATSFAAPFCP
jgi:hypothetical protein